MHWTKKNKCVGMGLVNQKPYWTNKARLDVRRHLLRSSSKHEENLKDIEFAMVSTEFFNILFKSYKIRLDLNMKKIFYYA